MICFPNAKINLGLNITSKRPDGFHNLETLFYPVPLYDVLEVIPAPDDRETTFTTTGIPIPGNHENNLVLKAIDLLNQHLDHPSPIAHRPSPIVHRPSPIVHRPSPIPHLKIHLHKVIPMGAGLGGGSSDGAFMLKLLNDLFSLDLPVEVLKELAARLGSDCPFFIENIPAYATGRGEELIPSNLDLGSYEIKLRFPPVHVDTAEAYSLIVPKQPQHPVKSVIRHPVNQWKGLLVNDFEEPVMKKYPVIREYRDSLYSEGALYASMTGSGSAVYGVFK